MQVLAAAVVETTQTWAQDGIAHGAVREIIGGVDETFVQRMMLVFPDLSTGYLLLEDVADERTCPPWKAAVDKRRTALGTAVWYVVSDRASALMQLAEQGLTCLSMPDFFHLMHDIVKSSSFAFAQQVRQAHKALTHAEAVLARHQALTPPAPEGAEANAQVEVRRAEVQRWEEGQRAYRQPRATLALTLHPFDIATSLPQTSAQVASR